MANVFIGKQVVYTVQPGWKVRSNQTIIIIAKTLLLVVHWYPWRHSTLGCFNADCIHINFSRRNLCISTSSTYNLSLCWAVCKETWILWFSVTTVKYLVLRSLWRGLTVAFVAMVFERRLFCTLTTIILQILLRQHACRVGNHVEVFVMNLWLKKKHGQRVSRTVSPKVAIRSVFLMHQKE